MEKVIKIGYVKSIQGEVSLNIQREHLINNGVAPEHIYEGDTGQTILDVIGSLRHEDDQIVIWSGAVVGRHNLKRLMREMSGLKNTLFNVKANKEIKFTEGDDIATLIDDMEAVERRNGGQGGKPNSISPKGHRRIHKMRDDGMNAREITEAMGYDESRKTTVWRYMKKPIYEGKE